MRKNFPKLCAVLALVTAIAFTSELSAQSSKYQFDDVVYQLPSGWKKGKTNDDHAVIYKSESGLKTIFIFRSEDVPRNTDRWMTKKIEILMDDGEKEEAKNMPSKTIPAGKHFVTIGGTVSGRKLWLAVANVSKQKANIVIMATRVPRNEDGLVEFSKKLTKEFLPFALTLKYISQGAQPVLGEPVAGDLEGTYSGLKYTYNLDMSTSFGQEFYTFSKSGRFLRGLPKGISVEKVDFEKALRDYPDRAGNYRIGRSKIHFEFADGTVAEQDFESTKNGFKMTQSYTRVTVPLDETKFEGLYRDLSYSGFTPGGGVSGGVANEPPLLFTNTGQSTATQFSGAFGNFENASGDTTGGFSSRNRRPKTQGTYKVEDGTLVLTDDKGDVSVNSLVQLGERLIYVNGKQYLKKKN